jgi:hypothetical protein
VKPAYLGMTGATEGVNYLALALVALAAVLVRAP